MISPKEFTEWVTLGSAIVAAIAGVWNLLLQLRGKRDRFVVHLRGASPSIDPEEMLYVVSHSDHPVKLTDWGFIEASGQFSSFRLGWETGDLHSEEVTSRGSSELKQFGDHFETGYVRKNAPLGAYAISSTQRRPCVCFAPEVPSWRRLLIRGRLWFQPRYLAW